MAVPRWYQYRGADGERLSPLGVPAQGLALVTGVTLGTAKRWQRRGRLPKAVAEFVQLRQSGDLGALDRAWRGFRLRDGLLWTPEGVSTGTGGVRALPMYIELANHWQRALSRPHQFALFDAPR